MTVPTPLQPSVLYKHLDLMAKQELPAGAAQVVHNILMQGFKLMSLRASKGRNAPAFKQALFTYKNDVHYWRKPLRHEGMVVIVARFLANYRICLPENAFSDQDLQDAMDLDAIIEMVYEQWELR